MSDRNQNSENNNYQDLIFDWKNPSMSTRPVSRKEEEVKEQAARREQVRRETVEDRRAELLRQRKEQAAQRQPQGRVRVMLRTPEGGTSGRVTLRTPEGGQASSGRVTLRTPESGTSGRVTLRNPEEEKTSGRKTQRAQEGGKTSGTGRQRVTGRKTGGDGGRKGSGAGKGPAKGGGRSGFPFNPDRSLLIKIAGAAGILLVLALVFWGVSHMGGGRKRKVPHIDKTLPEFVEEDYLTVNSYSRPGIASGEITGIVVHYTANPGSTAKENRDYFESLGETRETRASSHFIIGLEGEVLICVPLGEVAYASNSRNMDTVSIECCHVDESGEFTPETYASLVKLTKWLMERYGLTKDEVLRHYDVTGKLCPRYFVDHPEAWDTFLDDLDKAESTE